ncbi:hypothetical protein Cantr_00765 [Candida viswanathii]|uniref:MARVEL domain-containing protein n=1 Tax=Candida viswanathii TaxID=5486 RepID=A0A367YHF7_9ASCO|nr:hypothetical protein Cantr_00765 [Candida viswanathii]
MSSTDPTRTAKRIASFLFRLEQLAWPSITGLVLGGISLYYTDYYYSYYYWYYSYSYTNPVAIFMVVLYALTLAYLVFIVAVVPLLKNRICVAAIFIPEFLMFVGNISFAGYLGSLGLSYGLGVVMAVTGIVIHFVAMVLVTITAVIPICKESGAAGLFRREEFLFGCLFLDQGVSKAVKYENNSGVVQCNPNPPQTQQGVQSTHNADTHEMKESVY